MRECKEERDRFTVIFNERTRNNKHKLQNRKLHLNIEENFFTVCGETLKHVAQRVTMPGDTKNLTGHGPG